MSDAQTIASYDAIAAAYLARRQDRTVMAGALTRFVACTRPGGRVLDVGCGPGFDTAALRDQGLRTVGVDLSWGMLHTGRGVYGVPLVQADLRWLPFAPVWDGLWVNAALLHLPRPEVPAVLRRFHHLLRPGGCLYLSLKAGQGEGWEATGYGRPAPRWFTYWTAEGLAALLAGSGFAILDEWRDELPQVTWLNCLARRP